MTVERVAALVSCVGLALVASRLTRVDWAVIDNVAEPPDGSETIDSSLITLRSVRLGDYESLRDRPGFTWSQFVDVHIEADCVPDQFQISDPNRKWGEPRKNPHLLRGSLILEIVRRSSLGDGTVVEYAAGGRAKVDRHNKMNWSGRTWIPHISGEYRVRVSYLPTPRREAATNREPLAASQPIVLGVFTLTVRPGEPAA